MAFFNDRPLRHFFKVILLALFFVLYLVVFWFSFFSKGIFVGGHFYKKSASLTTITYTSKTPFADFDTITLQKQLDGAVITIDNAYTLTVDSISDSVSFEGDMESAGNLPYAPWILIAKQATEGSRGLITRQPYGLVLILYILFAAARHYSTKVYSFLFTNKAPNESYYKNFDKAFVVFTAVVMIYFILPV